LRGKHDFGVHFSIDDVTF